MAGQAQRVRAAPRIIHVSNSSRDCERVLHGEPLDMPWPVRMGDPCEPMPPLAKLSVVPGPAEPPLAAGVSRTVIVLYRSTCSCARDAFSTLSVRSRLLPAHTHSDCQHVSGKQLHIMPISIDAAFAFDCGYRYHELVSSGAVHGQFAAPG